MTDKPQVTYLTEAQAAELTHLGQTRSMECGAMTVTLRCAGCDGAAMDGGGPCKHDCHTPGVVDLSDLVKRRTGRPVAGDAYERGWTEAAAKIALEIRRELVCCTVYDEDADTERAGQRHAICFWGEAGARIAESVGRGDRD